MLQQQYNNATTSYYGEIKNYFGKFKYKKFIFWIFV